MFTGMSPPGVPMAPFAAMSPLEASPPAIAIWTIVSFLVLFFLLYKLAWPKLLSGLEERENAIRQALEDAERGRKEAVTLVEQHKKEIEKVKDEARGIFEEERVKGQELRTEIVAKAREEAGEIVEKAKEEINFEREKAVAALRREAVDISLGAAGKVLGRAITGEDHKRLVEEAVADLGKLNA